MCEVSCIGSSGSRPAAAGTMDPAGRGSSEKQYALYLRPVFPVDPQVLAAWQATGEPGVGGGAVRRAADAQRRWGGLHATVCSFRTKDQHGRALDASLLEELKLAMQRAADGEAGSGAAAAWSGPPAAAAAAAAAAGGGLTGGTTHGGAVKWRLSSNAKLPAIGLGSFVKLGLPHGAASPLARLTAAAERAGLEGVRDLWQLEVSLGEWQRQQTDVEEVRSKLRACKSWRLVVVQNLKAGVKDVEAVTLSCRQEDLDGAHDDQGRPPKRQRQQGGGGGFCAATAAAAAGGVIDLAESDDDDEAMSATPAAAFSTTHPEKWA
jgi:hypothetical protein